MMSDEEMIPVAPRLRCRHCQDVIGTYEPMVLETRHGPRETSLAAEPGLDETSDPCFHRACYGEASAAS